MLISTLVAILTAVGIATYILRAAWLARAMRHDSADGHEHDVLALLAPVGDPLIARVQRDDEAA